MNNNIYKYIDGQMSGIEKEEFEKLLEKDDRLKSEYELVRMNIAKLSQNSKIETDETYFNNVTVNFRTKLENKKTPRLFLLPKYSFVLPVAILVVMLSVMFLNPPSNNNMNLAQIINETDDSAKGELITEYADNSDSDDDVMEISNSREVDIIQTKLADELRSDGEAITKDVQLNYSDLNQVLENLSEKEQNEIYNEMINKKIL